MAKTATVSESPEEIRRRTMSVTCKCGKRYPVPLSPIRENQMASCECGKVGCLFLTQGQSLPQGWKKAIVEKKKLKEVVVPVKDYTPPDEVIQVPLDEVIAEEDKEIIQEIGEEEHFDVTREEDNNDRD